MTLKQNCQHFADNIWNCILLNEDVCVLIQISLKRIMFLWSHGQYVNIGFSNDLGQNRKKAITWTNYDAIQLCIYVSPDVTVLS